MKLNAFIHTETYSVQSIGPCLLELERETGYAQRIWGINAKSSRWP
ncbi:hypothetical protein [Leptothoe sp. PORK10 BA2]|nr:hypothetical protein [Leptothoe sp. PORK10 BA2]MEA5463395.1 hypothetical protein [Leptothoe sp. PORK10 BA2]